MRLKILSFIVGFAFLIGGPVFGGTVRTKDIPEKGGGYHDDGYHLKPKDNKEGFVTKEQHWRNPFKGFTNSDSKDTKKDKKKKEKN